MTATNNAAKFDVPPDETPVAACPYCDRPFRSEHLAALHLGEEHPEESTSEEHEAYEEAVAAEDDELFIYHLKVIAALVVVFMGFAYLYAFVLS